MGGGYDAALARAVIVAAHPDDEMIGLGAHLPAMRQLAAIVHVTDGAPRAGNDIQDAGCETWQQYAALRRTEFETALAASGIRIENNLCLWYPDRQASFRIEELTKDLARIFEQLQPRIVFTHPYEGGHPDHDAVAAAVCGAKRLAESGALPIRFTTMEFSSYHASPEGIECECFLENGAAAVFDNPLTAEQRERKHALLECYVSQKRILSRFPLQREPIRQAADYDFTRPLTNAHSSMNSLGNDWSQVARACGGSVPAFRHPQRLAPESKAALENRLRAPGEFIGLIAA